MGIISMVVLCNANAIIEYDRRRSRLPSAPLDMEYDNNITERYSLNIASFTYLVKPDIELLHIYMCHWLMYPPYTLLMD